MHQRQKGSKRDKGEGATGGKGNRITRWGEKGAPGQSVDLGSTGPRRRVGERGVNEAMRGGKNRGNWAKGPHPYRHFEGNLE